MTDRDRLVATSSQTVGPFFHFALTADPTLGVVRPIGDRDRIRLLISVTDGDGYADKATVFAKGFNSIQGLAYHAGTLYVMHAPFLTALRDKARGRDARFGPKRVPDVEWPQPLKVLTPAEGGDGREMPRVAVHS